jgi:hypothetical protein
MREFSRRMRKNTILIARRTSETRRPTGTEFAAAVPVPCSIQPLGDTGRRQDRFDEQHRLGEVSSYRVFVGASDLAEAGLTVPFGAAADAVRFNGRRYSLRGAPVAQSHDEDGTILSWSFDIDGIA